jgi:hypothetical protein
LGVYPFPVTVSPSSSSACTYLKQQLQPLQIFSLRGGKKSFAGEKNPSPKLNPPDTLTGPMPPDIDRSVGRAGPDEALQSTGSLLFEETRQPGRAAGPMPSKPFVDGR